MGSSKKCLQISMRMLLRGPMAEKAGVLVRQRCTSRLRRWTSRVQQPLDAPSLETPTPTSQFATRELFLPANPRTDHHPTEIDARTTDGTDHLTHIGRRLPHTWLHRGSAPLGWHAAPDQHPSDHLPFHGSSAKHYHSYSRAQHWNRSGTERPPLFERPGGQERQHTTSGDASEEKEKIHVTFINRDGSETTIEVPVGTNMLQAAHDNDIDLEGACEASLACSTCHVIFEEEGMYEKVPEPSEEENDMLDLAFGLTPTSRLGCQVVAEKRLDGVRLRIPSATRNFAVDGFVPKPH